MTVVRSTIFSNEQTINLTFSKIDFLLSDFLDGFHHKLGQLCILLPALVTEFALHSQTLIEVYKSTIRLTEDFVAEHVQQCHNFRLAFDDKVTGR